MKKVTKFKSMSLLTRLIILILLIIFMTLGFFFFSEGKVAQAADQDSMLAQSFSQYFSPRVLRAMDNIMRANNYEPLGHWKIWTDGFYRKYKRKDKKIEAILNWDGMYYIKDLTPEVSGDWTQFR